MTRKFMAQNVLWIIIAIIGVLAGRKAAAQGMDPDFPCFNPQTAEFCEFNESSKQWECKEDIICDGTDVYSGSATEDAASTQGTMSPLAVPCTSIEDRAGNYGDTIYIGAVYYFNFLTRRWYTNHEFGYCNVSTGGIEVVCSSVTNPLPVRLYEGNDTAGTVDVRRICLANTNSIGPWTDLSSSWQKIALNMYGCQGEDLLRGTPNSDKLFGGSNTNSAVGDTIYALAGNDIVRGDYETPSGGWCYVGTNCSSDSGTAGKDTLAGGYGNDDIWGGGGDDCDQILGEEGNDCICTACTDSHQCPTAPLLIEDDGCLENNWAWGGEGNDAIYGSDRVDYMWGGNGTDTFYGYDGDDFICTGCEPDPLFNYKIMGNDGDDRLVMHTNELITHNSLILQGDGLGDETGNDKLCYMGDGNFSEAFHVTFVPGTGTDCCFCATDSSDCGFTDCEDTYVGGADPCGCVPEGLECTCP